MPVVPAIAGARQLKSYVFALALVGLACFRLCHVNVLWADEDYHLAAAISLLHARIPYRDFWYDKPPLCAVYYLLIGGWYGWPLRLLDVAYVLVACRLAYLLARDLWGIAEAWTASLSLAFFTTFYLPSAVIPFAADALMIVPHLAAIYSAQRRRPLWAGFWSGFAFLFNIKGLFVFGAAALWLTPDVLLVALGFAIPLGIALLAALGTGAWSGYYEQVWRWGLIYAEGSPVTNPIILGFRRTADWVGFHAGIVIPAIYAVTRLGRHERWKLGIWLALSYAAVCLGTRFAPHYFLQVLPPVVILASRGIILAAERFRKPAIAVLALLLCVPLIRFGPRYVMLAADSIAGRESHWSDLALDLDSRRVAAILRQFQHPGDTLFVWGYRPDIYVYTRLTSDSLFWDSQPLTGVPADRHLRVAVPIYGGPARQNRLELIRSNPTFLVDGLGLMNPVLAPQAYPELRSWLSHYEPIARTKLSLIYLRKY